MLYFLLIIVGKWVVFKDYYLDYTDLFFLSLNLELLESGHVFKMLLLG